MSYSNRSGDLRANTVQFSTFLYYAGNLKQINMTSYHRHKIQTLRQKFRIRVPLHQPGIKTRKLLAGSILVSYLPQQVSDQLKTASGEEQPHHLPLW